MIALDISKLEKEGDSYLQQHFTFVDFETNKKTKIMVPLSAHYAKWDGDICSFYDKDFKFIRCEKVTDLN